jgi:membrane associated rhomboid family serine protease
MIPYADDVQTKSVGDVTILLIVICALIFAGEYNLGGTGGTDAIKQMILQWGMVPERLLNHLDFGQATTVLTSCFLHGGLAHLIGNMWFLYLFGRAVEDKMGRLNYLLFYLACGIFANLVYLYFNQASPIPCVGASGAIFGIMGAYIVFNPGANMKIWLGYFIGTLNVSALVVIGYYYLLNIASTLLDKTLGTHSETAYAAHLGGFICGLALAKFMQQKPSENVETDYAATRGRRSTGTRTF